MSNVYDWTTDRLTFLEQSRLLRAAGFPTDVSQWSTEQVRQADCVLQQAQQVKYLRSFLVKQEAVR